MSDDQRAFVRESVAWGYSGVLSASDFVKTSPGWVGGLLVTADDAAGNVDIILWDTDDAGILVNQICRITITELLANAQNSFATPSYGGIRAEEGIYLQVVAGNCEVQVYFK